MLLAFHLTAQAYRSVNKKQKSAEQNKVHLIVNPIGWKNAWMSLHGIVYDLAGNKVTNSLWKKTMTVEEVKGLSSPDDQFP